MEFLARNPFFRLIIPLIGGILIQEHLHFGWLPLIAIVGFSLILSGGFDLLPVKYKFFMEWVRGTLIILTFFALGAMVLKEKQENKPRLKSEKLTFTGQILDIPDEKDKTWQTTLRTNKIYKDGLWYPKRIKLLAYIEKNGQKLPVEPGDKLLFSAYPNPIKNQGNPGEFDYTRHMAIRGIHYQVYIDEASWKNCQDASSFSIIALSNRLRLKLLNQLKNSGTGDEEYAIASALLLGYKDLLTPEIKHRFSSSGAMHILAVSGLHVGIIYFILHYILLFLERYRYGKTTKILLILMMLIGYAFLTGLSPSVSRATLMFSVIAIGQVMRRYTSVYNSLAFSAFVLLIINPLLIFSISFQLSYLAVYSIVFFQPRIYKLIELPLIPDKLWQWFTVALAAQIGTAPIVIHHFNLFSNFFWLTNFIAIPAAAIIIFTGMLCLIVVPVSPFLTQLIGGVLSFVLSLLNQSTAFIEELPYSTSDSLWLSNSQILFYYLTIVFFSTWLIRKNSMYLKLGLVVVIAFLFSDIWSQYKSNEHKELLVYNIANSSVLNYIDGSDNYLFFNPDQTMKEEILRYTTSYWLSKDVKNFKIYNLTSMEKRKRKPVGAYKNFLCLDGTKIGYIDDKDFLNPLNPETKLELDYLILANDIHVSAEEVKRYFDVKMVIFDSSNTYYHEKALGSEMTENGIQFYSVKEQGALQVDL
ncbi:MAG: ComEC/Rec2 family competence protein [Bacteroidales bacterium]